MKGTTTIHQQRTKSEFSTPIRITKKLLMSFTTNREISVPASIPAVLATKPSQMPAFSQEGVHKATLCKKGTASPRLQPTLARVTDRIRSLEACYCRDDSTKLFGGFALQCGDPMNTPSATATDLTGGARVE